MFTHSKNQTVKTSIKVAAEDLSKVLLKAHAEKGAEVSAGVTRFV